MSNFVASIIGANFAADGNSSEINNTPVKCKVNLYGGATVNDGGGTTILQVSPDGGTTWVAVPSYTTTAFAANELELSDNVYGNDFRINLAGATTPDLDYDVVVDEVSNTKPILALDGVTANSNSTEFSLPEWVTELAMIGWGTWDTSTMKLQYTIDGGTTWKDVVSGSLTANGQLVLDVSALPKTMRVNLSSVGAGTDVSSKIYW